jgi:hypothetical protein
MFHLTILVPFLFCSFDIRWEYYLDNFTTQVLDLESSNDAPKPYKECKSMQLPNLSSM